MASAPRALQRRDERMGPPNSLWAFGPGKCLGRDKSEVNFRQGLPQPLSFRLAALRRNRRDSSRELDNLLVREGKPHAPRRRRTRRRREARPPFARRPDRPRRETAAAVWADVLEQRLDAIRAEGALEGADHRVGRVRRQVLVQASQLGLSSSAMQAASSSRLNCPTRPCFRRKAFTTKDTKKHEASCPLCSLW